MLQRHCRPPVRFNVVPVVVVATIIGAVMGIVVVPRVTNDVGSSKQRVAKHIADNYAYGHYRQWARDHPGTRCPRDLLDVALHAGKLTDDVLDPWGVRYRFYCGRDGVIVISAGPDRLEHTADDITSY